MNGSTEDEQGREQNRALVPRVRDLPGIWNEFGSVEVPSLHPASAPWMQSLCSELQCSGPADPVWWE